MSRIRLIAPEPTSSGPTVAGGGLDDDQRAAVDAIVVGSGPVLVTGGPGTGKSTVALAAVAHAVLDGFAPERVLLLAPTREAAARLRDGVSRAIGRPTGSPIARTPASIAYAILSSLAVAEGEPAPTLITGAEQDVMLREILAGHSRGDGHVPDWEGVVPAQATSLPGFREELRNLLMRAAEAGIDAHQLADLGRATGRQEWVAAAAAAFDYENATILRSLSGDQGRRYDPAAVTAEAADALDRWHERVTMPAPQWDLVVVDDFQDATSATARLLGAVHARGARVVLVGNADQTVQGYRGAAPSAMVRTLESMGAVARHELRQGHRQSTGLTWVSAQVAQRIGVIGGATAREWARQAAPEKGEVPVRVLTAPHRYGQSRAIAVELRRARYGREVPGPHVAGDPRAGDADHSYAASPVAWSRMVVIARSGAQLRALRSDLLAADVPCQHLGDGTALHEEPAVRPLLAMMRIALGDDWTAELGAEVLQSRIGGLDPVAVRRLRRALVREERAADGTRSSDELLAEAMSDESRWATVPGPEARAAAVVARAVAAAAHRIEQPGATPGAVLWAAWDTLGLAEVWREGALAGSDRDDADLDAVIALLKSAQTFAERMPEAGIGNFLEVLEAQDFAADSLGARALGSDGVAFATPASAAGREWDVVVVAGVEEGAWPDLRIRDSVLGAQVLADHATGQAPVETPAHSGAKRDLHSARAAVLDDETRAFLTAISRARHQVVVTAVDDGESRPSRYVALVEAAAGITREDAGSVRGIADLRGAVAALRVTGEASHRDGDTDQTGRAAQALARLTGLGVPGANPQDWHGVPEPSTAEGFWDADATIKVSPSRIDTVRKCALRWALESVGATTESSLAQNVGLLVHEIAAELPHGTQAELTAALDERWATVGGNDTWVERRDYESARDMVVRFARYVDKDTSDQVLVEQGFGVDLDDINARVSGIADRVEITDAGARVVDLKTGQVISAAEAADHGQLMLYQLAAGKGAFKGATHAMGAALVFLSSGVQPAVRPQEVFPVDQAVQELAIVVDRMRGPGYQATPNETCDRCPVRRSCPAQPSGSQVSES